MTKTVFVLAQRGSGCLMKVERSLCFHIGTAPVATFTCVGAYWRVIFRSNIVYIVIATLIGACRCNLAVPSGNWCESRKRKLKTFVSGNAVESVITDRCPQMRRFIWIVVRELFFKSYVGIVYSQFHCGVVFGTIVVKRR